MMTTDFGFGGPCPAPSCATVKVAADDAMTRKVTIAYFILTPSGAGRRSDDDVSTRAAEDVARRRVEQRAASGNCSGGPRNLTSLVRKKLISRVRGAGLRGQVALERGEPSQPLRRRDQRTACRS